MKNINSGLVVALIFVVGLFLFNEYNRRSYYVQPQEQPQEHRRPQIIYSNPQIVVPLHQDCHDKREFWMGYQDGYYGRQPTMFGCREYNYGYGEGLKDRRNNCHKYYDDHYPPNLRISVPGFSFQIR